MRKSTLLQYWRRQDDATKVMVLFAMEGLLWQYVTSVIGFGNALYATNLGANDIQIGLVQTVPNLTALCLLLPFGMLANRMPYARLLPMGMCFFMAVMYIFLGTVPAMGTNRLLFFFAFLALSSGVLAAYNAQWQSLFGESVRDEDRNRVYGFRGRFVYTIATVAPLLCGAMITQTTHTEEKLLVLRIFYYTCSLAMFLLGIVLMHIKSPRRSEEQCREHITLRVIRKTVGEMKDDKNFRRFFGGIVLFYLVWHIDWSMWYIGEMQYVGLSEFQLSIVNGLGSVASLLSIGMWSRRVGQQGVDSVFPFAIAGLASSTVAMLVSLMLPAALRPTVFIVLQTGACYLQGCLTLCTVQLLLRSVPRKNRTLIISLYNMVIILSNSLMPLLGVEIYTRLGADKRALQIFYVLSFLARVGVMFFYVRRAKKAAL